MIRRFFLDRCFALISGIAVVVASFLLIFPHEDKWTADRLTRRIHDLLLHAVVGRIEPNISAQIGLSMRDLILRLVDVPSLSAHYREAARNWAFGSFWIANTLLRVRHHSELYSDLMPPRWALVEQQWLDAITTMAKGTSTCRARAG
jgi:Fusaric acid resistance protein family